MNLIRYQEESVSITILPHTVTCEWIWTGRPGKRNARFAPMSGFAGDDHHYDQNLLGPG